ncbi:MAG: hypothetical protein JRJ34_08790 [Deltaproteobacteria bacterium]|nr:hypothetical protein [Deltaproteobacteria bacterium]
MYRILTLCLCLILCPAVMVMAQDDEIAGKTKAGKSEPKETGTKKSGAKELSGMSIVGDVPVDRDVFKRQLDFYQISTAE